MYHWCYILCVVSVSGAGVGWVDYVCGDSGNLLYLGDLSCVLYAETGATQQNNSRQCDFNLFNVILYFIVM